MKALKMQQGTVKEAKEQLPKVKEDKALIWSNKIEEGSKADFEAQLAALPDEDAIVWGN